MILNQAIAQRPADEICVVRLTIRDIRDELSWTDGMVYKCVHLAAKHALVKFEPGTREKNIKRLLPTDEMVGDFLPNPQRVLEPCSATGREIPSVCYSARATELLSTTGTL